MRKYIIITILCCVLFGMGFNTDTTSAKSKSNKQIAIEYCHSNYNGYTVKIVNYNKVPKNRKSHNKVYVEKLVTISDGGKNGHIVNTKYKVKYSKKVTKGKKEVCYCVYNPNNNLCDDVVAFVNCGTIK